MKIVSVCRRSKSLVDRYFEVELFLSYNLILKYLFRFRCGQFEAAGVVGRRDWSIGTTWTAFGAKSMGCIIWTTENDTTVVASQPDWPLTILALWMLKCPCILSSTERCGKNPLNRHKLPFIPMWILILFSLQFLDLYKKIKKANPPLSLHGQLLWREFFYCAATKNPKFDRMTGNPICVQIPWDKNEQALAKWANVCENDWHPVQMLYD